ncbi:ATP-binding protein [Prolixibacteraceae bacterium JC049]|nr:ATP-binding protein [Prolixibacteraceae bacterium JC049]
MSAIFDKIAEGEHQQQDFKFCINDSKKIAKSLVAFANTDGGRLLIGVKDNGIIAGVTSDEELYMVEAAAKIFSRPAIDFSVEQHVVNGRYVLEVDIPASDERPHMAKDENGKWWAFVRYNDENLLATRTLVEIWKREKSSKGILVNYGDKEKLLLNYLENNNTVTLSKLARLAKLPIRKAEQLIIDFVLLGVLEVDFAARGKAYKLNQDFDRLEWEVQMDKNY